MRGLIVHSLLILTACIAFPTKAVVIYDNGPPGHTIGWNAAGKNSDTPGKVVSVGDDFQFAFPRTLTDVHFFTLEWIDGSSDKPSYWDGSLTYSITEDKNGLPGVPLQTETLKTGVTKTHLGTTTSAFGIEMNEFEWAFDLADPLKLVAEMRYWIVLQLGLQSSQLFLEYTEQGESIIYASANSFLGGDPATQLKSNIAFALTGVPLPATTPLILIGLAGLAFPRRQRCGNSYARAYKGKCSDERN